MKVLAKRNLNVHANINIYANLCTAEENELYCTVSSKDRTVLLKSC